MKKIANLSRLPHGTSVEIFADLAEWLKHNRGKYIQVHSSGKAFVLQAHKEIS